MTAREKAAACLILALAVAGGVAAGWAVGHATGRSDGRALERGAQAEQTVGQLTALIDSSKHLAQTAGAASIAMRKAMGDRAAQDARTTKDFREALESTAGSRAGCVFPPVVMRGLEDSRNRAAEAATSGIRGGLSATASGAADER